MSAENIHIAGRYNKYLRNLSQSPWIDKYDVRVKDSVQEMIEDGLKKYLKFDKSIFTSSGREDVDVRMLGRGRPFAFKIINPQFLSDYNAETLSQVQEFVNKKHSGKVYIRDLQIVPKNDVSTYMTDTQDSKQKEYRALCCCTRQLNNKDIEKINSIKDLVIEQMTPIRVLHRRTWASRRRTIYRMRLEEVNMGDFDSVQEEYLERVFALFMTTEAGTYIKEFVHSDFGRTEPNLASLLGDDCETDLMELDVMEVYSDWPPEIIPISNKKDGSTSAALLGQQINLQNTEDNMETSTEALEDLYSQALKLMHDAETKPRGDRRQELYLQSRRLFERAMDIVESLSLFSDNETVEDITTIDLKYLLVPAYLAKITISAECSPNRLETFTQAESYMKKFLKRISHYGLGNHLVEKALKSYDCVSSDISQTLFAKNSVPNNLESAMRERNEKIERFKKAKELEQKLEELERRMKDFDQDQVDDEVRRDYYLHLVKKTIDETLESLEREVRPAIFFERSRSGDGSLNLEPESSSRAKSTLDQSITIVRDQHQKQVFGVGYPSRPTVTVDEFITKKINDGDLAFDKHHEIYANSLQRYAERPNLRREQEEQSDEEREKKEDRDDKEELHRKRKWDEFKDDNPRGSGNRYNMG